MSKDKLSGINNIRARTHFSDCATPGGKVLPDSDIGGATDLGGGLEYRTPTVLVRLEGSGHIQGQGADKSRVTFTARKSSSRLSLGLNLAADNAGLDTARLLHGEWRF